MPLPDRLRVLCFKGKALALAITLVACGGGEARTDAPADSARIAAESASAGVDTARFPRPNLSRPQAIDPVVARYIERLPDTVFVRRDACPFECCMYREWTARTAIAARAQPRDSALAGFTLQPGETFTADSGNVYVTSAQLVIVNDSVGDAHYWSFAPGDTLVVLDYTGEGYYHVWHDGAVKPAQGFWGGESAAADTIGGWKTEWWIHATRATGESGWFFADNSNRFDNADACGG